MLDRKARGLTADAKQKISLGRGLVRSDVDAILFDEPLTVIDPHLKWELRSQLKELHRELGLTMIYVTHDQTEALTFADKVVVMYDGESCRSARRQELFERPAHTFVGYFIGSPGMNVVPGRGRGQRGADRRPRRSPLGHAYDVCRPARRSRLGVRPEFVAADAPASGLPVGDPQVEDIGRHKIVRAEFDGQRRRHRRARTTDPIPGTTPRVSFDPARINIYADCLARRSGRLPDGQDRQQKAWFLVLPVLAARGVLRHHPADDGGELFGAGHLRQQPVLLERHRLVRGIARQLATASGTRCGATCSSRPSSSRSRSRSASSSR